MFILENVDIADDPDGEGQGNLDLIVEALQSVGYAVRIFKLVANDFGLPTRRVRLYFGGYHQKKQPEASFDLVEKLLNCFKLKCQKPEPRTNTCDMTFLIRRPLFLFFSLLDDGPAIAYVTHFPLSCGMETLHRLKLLI